MSYRVMATRVDPEAPTPIDAMLDRLAVYPPTECPPLPALRAMASHAGLSEREARGVVACRMKTVGYMRSAQIQHVLGVSKAELYRLLNGVHEANRRQRGYQAKYERSRQQALATTSG